MRESMSEESSQVTRDYLEATFQRGRKAMNPEGFEIDWDDQPSRFKVYPGVERLPLAAVDAVETSTLAQLMRRFEQGPGPGRALSFPELSTLLSFANGILSRRLAVNWNGDSLIRSLHENPIFGRGTPSGGGMYPTEIYLACGPGAELKPGIYHFDGAHHALERLSRRDATPQVRAALLGSPAAESPHFLLLALNFWKNAFKYNNFCYHVVTQDLGAMASSLRSLALSMGSDLELVLWYRDAPLNELLGLDTMTESVFAVMPIELQGGGEEGGAASSAAAGLGGRPAIPPSHQRSRRLVRFPMIEEVHRQALVEDAPRPSPESILVARAVELDVSGVRVGLPEPAAELLGGGVIEAFRGRQSSFGRFSSHQPVSLGQLTNMLHFASVSRRYRSDLKREDGTPELSRLMVIANHVEGLKRGAYSYDHDGRCLWTLHDGDLTGFLQRSYFLQNYNLHECAAVIALVAAVDPMIDTVGSRGYRIVNLEIGLVVQSIYLAASGMGIGCGAILGLDNINMNSILGLAGSDQDTLLFVMIGNQTTSHANYDFRLL